MIRNLNSAQIDAEKPDDILMERLVAEIETREEFAWTVCADICIGIDADRL